MYMWTAVPIHIIIFSTLLLPGGDSNGECIIVVPLVEIDAVSFDKGKNKPNKIMLKARKKGFPTYNGKSMEAAYELTEPVFELLLILSYTTKEQRKGWWNCWVHM